MCAARQASIASSSTRSARPSADASEPATATAPMVLVEEAGGRATDLEGRRAIGSGSFVVSNGLLHDEVLGRLRG